MSPARDELDRQLALGVREEYAVCAGPERISCVPCGVITRRAPGALNELENSVEEPAVRPGSNEPTFHGALLWTLGEDVIVGRYCILPAPSTEAPPPDESPPEVDPPAVLDPLVGSDGTEKERELPSSAPRPLPGETVLPPIDREGAENDLDDGDTDRDGTENEREEAELPRLLDGGDIDRDGAENEREEVEPPRLLDGGETDRDGAENDLDGAENDLAAPADGADKDLPPPPAAPRDEMLPRDWASA